MRELARRSKISDSMVTNTLSGHRSPTLKFWAIALVRATPTGVSTAFLQRKLGIGYPRAARLIDQLEEQGIIGPSAGGNTGREVLGEGAKVQG